VALRRQTLIHFLIIREILIPNIPKQIVISFYENFRKGIVVNCIKLKMTHSHNTYWRRFVTPFLTIIASSYWRQLQNKQSTMTKWFGNNKTMNWNWGNVTFEQVKESMEVIFEIRKITPSFDHKIMNRFLFKIKLVILFLVVNVAMNDFRYKSTSSNNLLRLWLAKKTYLPFIK